MGITPETYFEDDEYMSVSQFKKMQKCELDGITPRKQEDMSDALLMGSYIDAFVEGTLDSFIETHPEMFSSRGKTEGQLKAVFKQAGDICEYIKNDERIQQFLSGEKQKIMVGKINGVPFKIKMDSYSEGIAINDLKIMRSVTDSDGNFYDFIRPWGYDTQLACYQEIVYQNTGLKLPCFIVAVTKETPINSIIVNVPQHFLDVALYQVESQIVTMYEAKMKLREATKCGKCKTCISVREKTPIISLNSIVQN